jgi:UDP-glucose 4-epimerase
VDNFADFYPRSFKEANLDGLSGQAGFELVEQDLVTANLGELLKGVGAVAHLAAQAGVRSSWGTQFRTYTDTNVLATQQLLEACREHPVSRFAFASSSSVYGETQHLPLREDMPCLPLSPYGVTKLAAERLCRLYWKNFSIPTVSLRYFTVYGPGQRPDMAFHRLIRALLRGERFTVFGTGEQTRDFTYVDDIAEATWRALNGGTPGEAYNIGGGNRVSLNRVIELLSGITGREALVDRRDFERGDMMHTVADATLAAEDLGFRPATAIEDGLAREVAWLRSVLAAA